MYKYMAIFLLFASFIKVATPTEGVVCDGINCRPIEVQENKGRGLIRLREDQGSKTSGIKKNVEDKNFLFANETTQEQGSDLVFSELSVGMCLVDPADPTKYFKIYEKDERSTKISYVIENDDHNFMLKGNYAIWRLPDTSNALKKLRIWPCNRTPNLWDEDYVRRCLKTNKVGSLHCNPKKKF